jgi:pyruvate/2-oxoglutarate dehydrogenase complex dihydrolipoamide dehydrogenase (E3) component|tara:strand:+ start:86 stop:964 length:879 start_codon:yes stop_codon:yes gene_type:complete
MSESYDVIVLGSGPGGYVAAIRASQLGLKAAIVERELLGGICLNWGCIPTKALLRSAEIFHYMQHAKDYGLAAEKISADLDAVVKRSRGVAKQLNQGITHLMKKNKIAVHIGEGTLKTATTLEVKGEKGTETLSAKHIIVATGVRARDLLFAPADGKRVWTYRHAMVPPEMPTKLLVIGSGAIGIEFASFYNDMGAEVTVVECSTGSCRWRMCLPSSKRRLPSRASRSRRVPAWKSSRPAPRASARRSRGRTARSRRANTAMSSSPSVSSPNQAREQMLSHLSHSAKHLLRH